MLRYDIQVLSPTKRVIIVKAVDLQRYRLLDSNNQRIKFTPLGKSKALSIIEGTVQIWHKPNSLQFSKEYVKQNARTLWHSDSHADIDTIVTGLSEYENSI